MVRICFVEWTVSAGSFGHADSAAKDDRATSTGPDEAGCAGKDDRKVSDGHDVGARRHVVVSAVVGLNFVEAANPGA
jgi:hypothetical protein